MVFWQPVVNLREYITNRPPEVTFFFCLVALALSFFGLGLYSSTHTLPNPDVVKDWNHLLTAIARQSLCETTQKNINVTQMVEKMPSKDQNTMETSVALLRFQVPLILAPKLKNTSQITSLYTSFTSSQLQFEGNETYSATIDYNANESGSCLTITGPSYLTSLRPIPPACPQTAKNKDTIYTEVRSETSEAQKCYSLQSIYDPTLQVILTKEDQLIVVRHLLEVASVVIGVCLLLCLSVSLRPFSSQRHRWTEQDPHQEPLIDN